MVDVNIYSFESALNEAHRDIKILEAKLAAQTAVVDAARHALELGYRGEGSTANMLREALDALDKGSK